MQLSKGDYFTVTSPSAPYFGCGGHVTEIEDGDPYPVVTEVEDGTELHTVSYKETELEKFELNAPTEEIPVVVA